MAWICFNLGLFYGERSIIGIIILHIDSANLRYYCEHFISEINDCLSLSFGTLENNSNNGRLEEICDNLVVGKLKTICKKTIPKE
jgi:hypothetical protein